MSGFLEMPTVSSSGAPSSATAEEAVRALTDADIAAANQALRLILTHPHLIDAVAEIYKLAQSDPDSAKALIVGISERVRALGLSIKEPSEISAAMRAAKIISNMSRGAD